MNVGSLNRLQASAEAIQYQSWRALVTAPAAGLSLIPDGIDDDHAAAYLAGAGYLTGYLTLTEFAKFKQGQTVLAPGIGGAVGTETGSQQLGLAGGKLRLDYPVMLRGEQRHSRIDQYLLRVQHVERGALPSLGLLAQVQIARRHLIS